MPDSYRLDAPDPVRAAAPLYREVDRQFFGHLALIPVNVYTREPGQAPALVAIAGSDIDELPAASEVPLLVTEADLASLRAALPEALTTVLAAPQPWDARLRSAYDLMTTTLAPLLESGSPGIDEAAIQACVRSIDLLVEAATTDNQTMRQALGVMRRERDWQLDAINTCLYAVAIGRAMGVAADELSTLAHGAFFHDIGKTRLPRSMLDSTARLTMAQRIKLRQHPARGVEMLREALGSEPTYAPIVLRHHERIDGSGYPDGREALPLDRLCQIVGLADVFEALTAARPHRPPEGPFAAARIIVHEMRGAFDADILRSLIIALGDG